jgi:hypothetical protein
MPLAQPKIMFVFDQASGKTVANYGSAGTAAINSAVQCIENTDFAWVAGASPLLSYLSLITKDSSPATSSQPFIDLTGYTLGTTFTHIYTAVGFRLTSLDTTIFNEGYLSHPKNGAQGGFKLRVTPNGGGFDLFCHWESQNFNTVGENTFTGLSFGTDYRVVAYCDPTNTAAVVTKFLLDGGSVIAPATTNPGSDIWDTDVGWIDRRHDFAVYGGVVARLYYWVHDRGVALADADMAAINSDPSTAWTGWPSSGSTRGEPFNGGTAFNSGRTFAGIIR